MHRRVVVFLCLVMTVGLLRAATVTAQSRFLVWERWDVLIDEVDTAANTFRVVETQVITATGRFEGGLRAIPTENIDDIIDVAVYQDDRAMTLSGARSNTYPDRGEFTFDEAFREYVIDYSFFTALEDETTTLRFEYTVVGGLRVFDETTEEGGDQLWWGVVPADRPFTVESSTVTVELPDDLAPRPGIDPIETYGAAADVDVEGSVVTAVTTEPLPPDVEFDVRIQYPHTLRAVQAAWQEFDERELIYHRWDLRITDIDPATNTFRVTETLDIEFVGPFEDILHTIATADVDDITDHRVRQGETTLDIVFQAVAPGQVRVLPSFNRQQIFINLTEQLRNEREALGISYTVVGGLRVFDDRDELNWTVISPDQETNVAVSAITVELPDEVSPLGGTEAIEVLGADADVSVDGSVVTIETTEPIGAGSGLGFSIPYPHTEEALISEWQTAFNALVYYETVTVPRGNLALLVVALVLGVGSALLALTLWLRGRNPRPPVVPDYITEPPADVPPAVAGAIWDSRIDFRDILSTLIDLARRGYVRMEENKKQSVSYFTFKRTDQSSSDLTEFERRFLDYFFMGKTTQTTGALKNRFYASIPPLRRQLTDLMKDEGLVSAARLRFKTTAQWLSYGLLGLGAALFLLAGFGVIPVEFGAMLAFVIGAAGVGGAALLIAANRMPKLALTAKGMEVSAMSNAFREYLRNLEDYADLEEAEVKAQFDRYLPFTIAFGIDYTWVNRFRQVDDVPAPTWYVPVMTSQTIRRAGETMRSGRSVPGASSVSSGDRSAGGFDLPTPTASPTGTAGGGLPSLDDMSSGLSGGLSEMSSGLSNMLNSASRSMTSRPAPQPKTYSGGSSSGFSGSRRSSSSSWSGGRRSSGSWSRSSSRSFSRRSSSFGRSGGGRSGFR